MQRDASVEQRNFIFSLLNFTSILGGLIIGYFCGAMSHMFFKLSFMLCMLVMAIKTSWYDVDFRTLRHTVALRKRYLISTLPAVLVIIIATAIAVQIWSVFAQ